MRKFYYCKNRRNFAISIKVKDKKDHYFPVRGVVKLSESEFRDENIQRLVRIKDLIVLKVENADFDSNKELVLKKNRKRREK